MNAGKEIQRIQRGPVVNAGFNCYYVWTWIFLTMLLRGLWINGILDYVVAGIFSRFLTESLRSAVTSLRVQSNGGVLDKKCVLCRLGSLRWSLY